MVVDQGMNNSTSHVETPTTCLSIALSWSREIVPTVAWLAQENEGISAQSIVNFHLFVTILRLLLTSGPSTWPLSLASASLHSMGITLGIFRLALQFSCTSISLIWKGSLHQHRIHPTSHGAMSTPSPSPLAGMDSTTWARGVGRIPRLG